MDNLRVVGVGSVLPGRSGEGGFQRGSPPADSEEAALRGLVPKVIASWESLDITKVEPYYATDADFAYFDLAPIKYNNWAEYRAGVQKAIFEPNQSIKFKLNADEVVHERRSLTSCQATLDAD